MSANDPWQEARDEFENETLPQLGKIGKAIGAEASNGNEKAQEIVSLYTRLHRSFDPMTHLMLKTALTNYSQP